MEHLVKETQAGHARVVAKDHATLCEAVVGDVLDLSKKKIKEKGQFVMALSGGETPKGVYSLMAMPGTCGRFEWDKIHFFWGDERCVPPSDPRSNYGMVRRTLLEKIKMPEANVHFIRTQGTDPGISASLYEREMLLFFKLNAGEVPCFDLVLLGLGRDGHVASLFPESPALCETKRLATHTSLKATQEARITLTLPVINRAQAIFFLASGLEKAQTVRRILETKGEDCLPANRVRPSGGNLRWYLDRQAASGLKSAGVGE